MLSVRLTFCMMTCTCNCSMHISSHATAPCTFHHMQLLHAHSAHATAPCMHIQHLHVLAQARPTMFCIRLVGASVSEPHIDEFNVNFLYFYIYFYISIYIYIYRTSCRKSLPARILRVLASCVISKLSSLKLPARALISSN